MTDPVDRLARTVADVIAMSSVPMGSSKDGHEAFIADGQRRLNAIADLVMADAEMRRSVKAAPDPRLGTLEDIDPLGR